MCYTQDIPTRASSYCCEGRKEGVVVGSDRHLLVPGGESTGGEERTSCNHGE